MSIEIKKNTDYVVCEVFNLRSVDVWQGINDTLKIKSFEISDFWYANMLPLPI